MIEVYYARASTLIFESRCIVLDKMQCAGVADSFPLFSFAFPVLKLQFFWTALYRYSMKLRIISVGIIEK